MLNLTSRQRNWKEEKKVSSDSETESLNKAPVDRALSYPGVFTRQEKVTNPLLLLSTSYPTNLLELEGGKRHGM